ncbi:PAS domain S-box protein [Desulfovibrio gilichinskyi]|uniref:Sensory/regulatory protein RpfC n=1 Tax=Desulfovibrio gilichinskyi TaxID=1519643 RepID=A0A1X7DFS5_9BACT|nr:PAS domain S-box protein [Desulfovibrio gilichinskyi]SMF14236.1 PAS domain S-box-containing protein [Desulfovibrio gilichinskyi]
MFLKKIKKNRIAKILKSGLCLAALSLFLLSSFPSFSNCAQIKEHSVSYAVFSGNKINTAQNLLVAEAGGAFADNESSQSQDTQTAIRYKTDSALEFSVLSEIVMLLVFVILLIFFWNRKLFKLNQILNAEVAQRRKMEIVQNSLYRIALAVTEVSGMEEFYSIVQKSIAEFMYASNFYIAIYDHEKDELSFPYFAVNEENVPAPRTLGKGFTDYVIRTGEPLLADESKQKELIASGEFERIGKPSVAWIGIPLSHEGKTVGVLSVQSFDDGEILNEVDLELLMFISPYIGIAFDRLQLHEHGRLKALELQESEERFRILFEESSDAVVLINGDSIVQCNRAASGLLQMSSPSELIGLQIKDISPANQTDKFFSTEKVNKQITGGAVNGKSKFESNLQRADGNIFPVEVLLTPIYYKGQNLVHCVWRDITERKLAEAALTEREVKYRALFDYANDAIVLMDLKGNYVSANPEAISMFGCDSEEEFQSYSPADFMPDIQPNGVSSVISFAKNIQMAIDSGSLEYEGVGKRLDGENFYVNIRVRPLVVNGETLLLGNLRDITERKNSREQIKRSVSLLTATIESSADGILAVDGAGLVVAWNSRLADMWNLSGVALDEGVAADIFNLILDQVDGSSVLKDNIWNSSFESDLNHVDELNLKDGRIIERYSNPQRIGSEVVGRVWSFRDVTARRRSEKDLAESYRRLHDIIEFLPDPAMVVDSRGVVVAWNRAMEEVTGVAKENMLGKGDHEYSIPFYGERKLTLLSRAVSGGKESPDNLYEFVQRKGDMLFGEFYAPNVLGGEGAYLWGVARPLRDSSGKIYGGIECLRNVTDRRRVAKELTRAKLAAEAATRAKSEFLANMSHEIRTPMNSIIGLGHLVLNSTLDIAQRESLEKMMSSADSLLSIIEEILDFSKIEACKLVLERTEFELDGVLDKLCNLVAIKAEEKGLDFVLSVAPDVPHRVIGDPLRLEQILTNLTNNAIKFTKKGEVALFISCKGTPRSPKGTCIRFTVKDSGIGLSKEEQAELFKAFSQADASTTRKFGGTGLGLAISKSLVNLMGGDITVQSQTGVGSSFEFDVDFAIIEDSPRLVLPDCVHKMKVLVIDDNENSRQFIGDWLESLSLETSLTDSVDSGVELLQSGFMAGDTIDLIFMNYDREHEDHFKAVKLIRSNSDLIDTPIVMMLPFGADENIRKQASFSGVNGFISKPATRVSLYQSVVDVFKLESIMKTHELASGNKKLVGFGGRSIKALLVEDNQLNQHVATKMLESLGLSVTVAENGRQALDLLWAAPFDIVLMDIQMPEMDGLTATRIIRSDEHYKDLPILAMTAHAMQGDREKSLVAGMNDHITKPISPSTLLAVLKKYIKSKSFSYIPISRNAGQDGIVIPELAGIDTAKGLSNIGGNKKGYLRVLKGFKNDYGKFADEFKILIDKLELEKAAMNIHSLKGVSGNIGANRLYDLCRSIENEIHEYDEDRMNGALNRLTSELTIITKALNGLPDASVNESTVYTDDKEKSFELINKLYNLLKDGDADSYDVLEKLISFIDPERFEGQLQTLTQHIDNLDFDKCCLVLEKIADELGITLNRGTFNG